MLTEIYIEALLADEDLADQVWTLWDAGIITDELAALAWCILAGDLLDNGAICDRKRSNSESTRRCHSDSCHRVDHSAAMDST